MHAPIVRPSPGTRQAEPLCAAALALLCAAILAWRWVGFQGHDDFDYAAAALDWLHHPPALGDNHWALRYPLVVPMAAALAVFGKSLWVLALPTLVAYLAWLGFTYAAMRAALGWQAAALATLAAILVPEFPVQATYANPDILELVFLLGSFWCFQSALRRPDRTLDLVHCGTLAGLGFLTRETAAAIIPFYALVFLFRPGMPRRAYLPIAAAFATIVALEFLYFWLRAGDPLYRLHLSATHDTVNRAAQAAAAAAAGHALDTEGVLAGPPLFQIVSVLFISQKYGPLFLLAIPATFYARGATWLAPRERRVITDAAFLALCLVAFVALAAGKLYIVPRYFTAAAGAALIPVAAAGALLWQQRPRLAATLTAAFAAICLPLLAMENVTPLFAVHRLVALARTTPLHTDPFTAGEAAIPLAFAGLTARVSTAPPQPGDTIALPEHAAADCRQSRTCGFKDSMAPFIPGPSWTLLRREAEPPRPIGRLIRAAGLARKIPPDIMRKLENPNAALEVYKVKD